MNEAHGPLDRLEARLEQLAARVDELSRIVELGGAARAEPDEAPRPVARERMRRKRRSQGRYASRI